jgi:hypothetical protein
MQGQMWPERIFCNSLVLPIIPLFQHFLKSPEKDRMEKRNFNRIPFQTKAIVRSKDATVIGIVENLSLDGIFLKTPEKLNLNRIVKIEVLITGTSSQLSILLDGKIMRHENVGMAIQFKNVDMDAFFHLKNLISHNLNQVEKLTDDFQIFIKKKGKKKT